MEQFIYWMIAHWWLCVLFIMAVFTIQFCWIPCVQAYRWRQIKKYLKGYNENPAVHKMIWYGCAFLTEKDGTRHKVSGETHTLDDVKKLINDMKKRFYTS
jgi:hypothetical protein